MPVFALCAGSQCINSACTGLSDGDGWGPKAHPNPSRMGRMGLFFFRMGVFRQQRGPSSARESANWRGPPESQCVILSRLGRFIFRNLVLKPCDHTIVCKVGRMLICCTVAGTHNFQIVSDRVQYRLKWRVLGHIRPPSTLQNFHYSKRYSHLRPRHTTALSQYRQELRPRHET